MSNMLVRFLASPPTFYEGSVTANWQSGVATSGGVGADFLTIGDATTIYYTGGFFFPMVAILIGGLTPGATISWRSYMWAFGAMYLADWDSYVVGVDEDVMGVGAWTYRGPVRVELQSDAIADNGAAIRYEYLTKVYE